MECNKGEGAGLRVQTLDHTHDERRVLYSDVLGGAS